MGLRAVATGVVSEAASSDAASGAASDVTASAAFDLIAAPVIAFGLVGVLVLLLRWTFGHGRSIVEQRPRRGAPQEYGLLVVASEPSTFIEAEAQRRLLVDAGVRATLAPTTDGPRVLVFPADEGVARALLR